MSREKNYALKYDNVELNSLFKFIKVYTIQQQKQISQFKTEIQ